MSKKFALGASIGAFALALAVPAMQAQHVSTDYDHKAPFTDYRTFSIAKIQTVNPLDADVIRSEIRRDLTYHNLREIPKGGDVAITAIGGQQSVKQYQSFYDGLGPGFGYGGYGGWWGGGFGGGYNTTTVHEIPIGTLVVDMYDGQTHNLVFRGTSHETDSDNMNKNSGKLQKAVDEMFYKFPPKHAM